MKTLSSQIKNRELSPESVIFYSGIAQANSGLLRLASAVKTQKINEIDKRTERER